MGLKRFFRRVGKVVAYPVTKPISFVHDKLEDAMLDGIKGIIRHVITTLAGSLIANGVITESDLQAIIGGVLVLISVIWSWVSKKKPTP
jgi:hypothetical protein